MTAAPAWEKLALTVLRKADPPGELGVKALRKKVVKRAAKKQASADLAQLREAFDAALPTLRGVSVRDCARRRFRRHALHRNFSVVRTVPTRAKPYSSTVGVSPGQVRAGSGSPEPGQVQAGSG